MLNPESLQLLKQLKADLRTARSVIKGKIRGTPHRYGFVIDQDQKTHFLQPDEMSKVLPGDEVVFSLVDADDGKQYAEITEVMSSSLVEIVGRFVVKGQAHFVEADMPQLSRSFYVPAKEKGSAVHGDFVSCSILRHPYPSSKPQVRVAKVICHTQNPMFRHHLGLARHRRSLAWSSEVMDEVAHIKCEYSRPEVLESLKEGRVDLTHLPFVTIDAATTEDMDDALYVEPMDEGWRLWVAIADPTTWVAPGSVIDQEAFARASSVYLPGLTVPMLPEFITYDLCSLKSNQDRLAIVVSLMVSTLGEASHLEYHLALVRSRAKLSYQAVTAFVEQAEPLEDWSGEGLVDLVACATSLRVWRERNALIMRDRPDYSIEVDGDFQVVGIERQERTQAHRVVEECMLAVNRVFAQWFKSQGHQSLFIGHSGFRANKWPELYKLLLVILPQDLVVQLALDVKPPELAGYIALMQALAQASTYEPIVNILQRNLDRSQLQLEPKPHCAMGFPCYLTLTSPIRKYSDFWVHRQLKALMTKASAEIACSKEQLALLQEALLDVRQLSQAVEQWYQYDFMSQQDESTVWAAQVIQVNANGVVVRLDVNGIEGFVHLKRHKKVFKFDSLRLTQSTDQVTYQIGTNVQVSLKRLDQGRRSVEFQILESL